MKFQVTEQDLMMFEPLEPGLYDATLVAIDPTAVSAKGNSMVVWVFKISGPPEKIEGKGTTTVKLWTISEPKTMSFIKTLQAFGVGEKEVDPFSLVGKSCSIYLEQELDQNGVLRNVVRKVTSA